MLAHGRWSEEEVVVEVEEEEEEARAIYVDQVP